MTQPKTDTRNIYQRLHAVMGEVTYVQKQRNKGMHFSTVSHDVVTAKVRPPLHKHGVIYHPINLTHTQNGNRTEVSLEVRFVNIDNPSDFVDVPGLGYGVDPQDKGPGKAISYAVKYALLKALGLETGDDADHDSIDHEPEAQKPAPQSITPQQEAALSDLFKNLGENGERMKHQLLEKQRIEKLGDLSARLFEDVHSRLMKVQKLQGDADAA